MRIMYVYEWIDKIEHNKLNPQSINFMIGLDWLSQAGISIIMMMMIIMFSHYHHSILRAK